MAQHPSLVTIGPGQQPFTCLVCDGELFADREIKLNTTGLELFGMEWANRSATGLICADCGYLHTFASDTVRLWEPGGGYPEPDEG